MIMSAGDIIAIIIKNHIKKILKYIKLLATFSQWRDANEYLDQKHKTEEDDDGVDGDCDWVGEAEDVLKPIPTLGPVNVAACILQLFDVQS